METEVIALLIVWSPVEVAVVALIVGIYRKVQKLAASMEMLPNLSAEERRFVAWWGLAQLRGQMKAVPVEAPGKEPWNR